MKKSVFRSLSLITQLGVSVMVPTFLCLAVGLFIDSKFSTWFSVPLLFLGLLAGGRNAYVLAKGVINENSKDE
ncbi:MAG: AtpZ/AtpI family protein [Lachnospiraceae bacterium]|nr:AtpZ/AtpI family protein [Lachnospiraceae bacterium]